jgi:OmpR family response regulator RpaB
VVRGLNLGAQDYVTKPFSPRVLQARINSLLRRTKLTEAREGASTITVGDLRLDADWRTVSCGEHSVRLTRLEFSILQTLAIHAGLVVSHQNLIQRVWGYKDEGTSQISKGHIRNLRTKLKEIGSRLTVRVFPAFGYRLECEP